MDGNLHAFLEMISACEGTYGAYNALFGYTPSNGRVFDNGYATHPRISSPFTDTNGQQQWSTAAGKYQIIYPTFARLQAKLRTTGFGPEVQDMMACELIAEAGAMPDVKDGDLGAAIDECSGIWASLPDSRYPQPVRPYMFAQNAYVTAGGVIA